MQSFYLCKHRVNGSYDEGLNQEVCEKKEKLDLYVQLRSEGCCERTALSVIGVSRATYFRWRRKFEYSGLAGLESGDKTPKRKRTPTWSKNVENLVLKARINFPMWGKCKIATVIKREHGVKLSFSMVGRIITKLLRQNKIQPVSFYYGKIKPKRKRVFLGHAKRWKYGMKAEKPGELVQIDHATIKLINGIQVKHFKAICPVTKFVAEQAYRTATSFIGEEFLNHIVKMFPFEIKSIQVDGGSEFMGTFEIACKTLSIPLYVLPPRRPQYNGTVERGHGIVKYEFYYQYCGASALWKIRDKLKEFTHFYNTFRPHQRLNYMTPMQYYIQLAQLEAKKSHMS